MPKFKVPVTVVVKDHGVVEIEAPDYESACDLVRDAGPIDVYDLPKISGLDGGDPDYLEV